MAKSTNRLQKDAEKYATEELLKKSTSKSPATAAPTVSEVPAVATPAVPTAAPTATTTPAVPKPVTPTVSDYERAFGPAKRRNEEMKRKESALKDNGQTKGTFVEGELVPDNKVAPTVSDAPAVTTPAVPKSDEYAALEAANSAADAIYGFTTAFAEMAATGKISIKELVSTTLAGIRQMLVAKFAVVFIWWIANSSGNLLVSSSAIGK
jgi:hypothetical protein